jgi:hypothetical protein
VLYFQPTRSGTVLARSSNVHTQPGNLGELAQVIFYADWTIGRNLAMPFVQSLTGGRRQGAVSSMAVDVFDRYVGFDEKRSLGKPQSLLLFGSAIWQMPLWGNLKRL